MLETQVQRLRVKMLLFYQQIVLNPLGELSTNFKEHLTHDHFVVSSCPKEFLSLCHLNFLPVFHRDSDVFHACASEQRECMDKNVDTGIIRQS